MGVTLFSGGPVTKPLFTGTITAPDSGNACGWTDLTAVAVAMRSGDTYVNAHTPTHRAGEIRGQIKAVDVLSADVEDIEKVEFTHTLYLPVITKNE